MHVFEWPVNKLRLSSHYSWWSGCFGCAMLLQTAADRVSAHLSLHSCTCCATDETYVSGKSAQPYVLVCQWPGIVCDSVTQTQFTCPHLGLTGSSVHALHSSADHFPNWILQLSWHFQGSSPRHDVLRAVRKPFSTAAAAAASHSHRLLC